jgi:hypothetical protein
MACHVPPGTPPWESPVGIPLGRMGSTTHLTHLTHRTKLASLPGAYPSKTSLPPARSAVRKHGGPTFRNQTRYRTLQLARSASLRLQLPRKPRCARFLASELNTVTLAAGGPAGYSCAEPTTRARVREGA